MNAKLVLGFGILLFVTGCGGGYRTVREPVPPRVDLHGYQTVGLVTFSTNSRSDIDRVSTARFLRAVQAAQPGTRVVELGSEERVMREVNRARWDRETLAMVKERFGVDAVLIGRIEVERQRPDVRFSAYPHGREVEVNQDVNAELSARLLEVDSGATVWSDGAKCTTNLSNAAFDDHGRGGFGARNAEATYGEMVDGLVFRVTDAFRVHYIVRQIPIETSSGSVARAE
jgi:hypothetical protein